MSDLDERLAGRGRPIGRRAGGWLLPAIVVTALLGVLGASSPVAATARGEDAGESVVVAHEGATQRVRAGGSTTEFSLRLPEGASCPGDSADGDYRVQSFLVPAGDDPGALRYKSLSPEGAGRYSLYDANTRSYVQVLTAAADVPGGPGLIVDIPAFSFAVFPPGELADGRYHVGIACTLLNETVRYWHADLDLMRAPQDKPAEIHWTVVPTESAGSGTSAALIVFGAALGMVLVVVTAVIVRRRRRALRVDIPEESR